MIRTFLEEFVFPILLFVVLRSVMRGWLAAPGRSPAPPRPPEPIAKATELKKDPVCGTYVSSASAFNRTVNGQVICFCSKECRDRYSPVG
jgi:YHS domain-containing protein